MRIARITLALMAVAILVGFATITIKSGATAQDINFNAPKLESTEDKLKSKNVQIESLNIKLHQESSQDQKTIDEQKKQLEQLEQERQELIKKSEARAEEKRKLAEAAANAVNKLTATQTASAQSLPVPTYSGSHEEWLAAAGIPQSDWVYVDCVINGCQGVSAEGGWGGVTRWNTTGSGAYGLCQALPGSKMASAGADWETNPVTQLKWCHSYAMGYGSWAQAWEFRKCLGSCYSTRTNNYQDKDHTWW